MFDTQMFCPRCVYYTPDDLFNMCSKQGIPVAETSTCGSWTSIYPAPTVSEFEAEKPIQEVEIVKETIAPTLQKEPALSIGALNPIEVTLNDDGSKVFTVDDEPATAMITCNGATLAFNDNEHTAAIVKEFKQWWDKQCKVRNL